MLAHFGLNCSRSHLCLSRDGAYHEQLLWTIIRGEWKERGARACETCSAEAIDGTFSVRFVNVRRSWPPPRRRNRRSALSSIRSSSAAARGDAGSCQKRCHGGRGHEREVTENIHRK